MFGMMSVARLAGQPGGAFSLLSLFANGEQGLAYDPSDFSTLFQDSAGTTPVTAVEQPVGLILDKRLGLALGAELIANGDFSDGTTGWYIAPGWGVVDGALVAAGAAAACFPLAHSSVIGVTYLVTIDVSVGSLNVFVGGQYAPQAAPGTFAARFTATNTNGISFSTVDGATIDNISVREIAGNHAAQGTAAARPVVSARKNYLWEDLTGSTSGAGNWTKQAGVTVDSLGDGVYRINFAADGLGVFSSVTGANGIAAVTGATYIGSVELATESGAGTVVLREPIGSQFADTDKSLTTTWLRVSTPSFVASSADCGLWIAKKAGSISSVLVRFPQLEFGSTATRYQRVTTATDYDTVGFPHRIDNDGIDDLLATTLPDLGTDATIARAVPMVGTSILTAQTIGAGVRNDSTDHAGLVIIDRALTAGETAALTAYLDAKAGV